MTQPSGYSGTGKFKRQRTDVGEPGFWMGRQFGVSYEFSIASRQVLKFMTPVDAILYVSNLHIDAGGLYYRVFGYPDDSIETAAFTNPVAIHPLNTMSVSLPYANQVRAYDDGDIDETGLDPYPTARLRASNATGQRNTTGIVKSDIRGFGPANAYIVMELLSGVTGPVTGVIDLKFEERDWGY